MAKHDAQVGDTYRFFSPDGTDRITVRFDANGLYVSRDTGGIIILPRGTNVIELPFNMPEPTKVDA